jgi:hypothetical protein
VQQLEAQIADLQAAQQELSALISKNDQSENGKLHSQVSVILLFIAD